MTRSATHRTPPVAGLRAEVLRFKRASPRGLVAPTLWVGAPGGAVVSAPATLRGSDDHLRREVLGTLWSRTAAPGAPVAGAPEWEATPLAWVTRSGPLEPALLDVRWWAAVRAVWEENGAPPAFAVVTRQGWRFEPGDLRHQWRRLR